MLQEVFIQSLIVEFLDGFFAFKISSNTSLFFIFWKTGWIFQNRLWLGDGLCQLIFSKSALFNRTFSVMEIFVTCTVQYSNH